MSNTNEIMKNFIAELKSMAAEFGDTPTGIVPRPDMGDDWNEKVRTMRMPTPEELARFKETEEFGKGPSQAPSPGEWDEKARIMQRPSAEDLAQQGAEEAEEEEVDLTEFMEEDEDEVDLTEFMEEEPEDMPDLKDMDPPMQGKWVYDWATRPKEGDPETVPAYIGPEGPVEPGEATPEAQEKSPKGLYDYPKTVNLPDGTKRTYNNVEEWLEDANKRYKGIDKEKIENQWRRLVNSTPEAYEEFMNRTPRLKKIYDIFQKNRTEEE